MCQESFQVIGLRDQRTAYEVEEYLAGIPPITRVQADVIDEEIFIEWNGEQMQKNHILDHIEYAGCTPQQRISGVFDYVKTKIQLGVR